MRDWVQDKYAHKVPLLQGKPFPYIELPHFFQAERINKVFEALQKEEFSWKEADLFQFWQTADLQSTTRKVLQEFRSFLSSAVFIEYMQRVTGIRLKKGIIDMAGTLYKENNFLLPHDDKFERRKIAYFLYFSQVEGGELQLFQGNKVEARIRPGFNKFAFFVVSHQSVHQVAEVLQGQRLAISGWFYG